MRKFSVGVVVGLLISLLAFATFAVADSPIKLIINGQAIDCKDTPPQIINGRTYVPARYVAEPLGATVEWDAENRAVVITDGAQVGAKSTDLSQPSSPAPNEWTSFRDLTKIHGFKISNDGSDNFFVSKNNKSLGIDIFPEAKNGIYQAAPQLQMKVDKGMRYFIVSELNKALGI